MLIQPLSTLASRDLANTVFVYPTDTCYGIGCNALERLSVEKIYRIKHRQVKKPLSIMVDSVAMFREYGQTNDLTERLIQKYLPGQLTIVVPKTNNLPSFLNPEDKTIGIRIPAHAFCHQLIRSCQAPIITTSANISGKESLYDPQQILREFTDQEEQPDLLFDTGVLPEVLPSTVVEVTGDRIKILRQGGIEVEL